MLVMMYHMLRDGVDYQELGHDYLDKLQPQRLTRSFLSLFPTGS